MARASSSLPSASSGTSHRKQVANGVRGHSPAGPDRRRRGSSPVPAHVKHSSRHSSKHSSQYSLSSDSSAAPGSDGGDDGALDDDTPSDSRVPRSLETPSVIKPCNRFGFFMGSEEANFEERTLAVEVIRRREAKWILMLNNEKSWNKLVVKNFRKVRRRCRKGIPHSIRGKAWLYLSGGHKRLSSSDGLFEKLDSSEGDPIIEEEINRDLHRQFPSHEMFAERDGFGQRDLFRVLKAFSIMKPEIGYCQGQAPLASVLLMHMPAEQAFWSLIQICEYFIPGYFSPGLEAIQLHADMLFALLKRYFPVAYKLLKKQKIEPILYMTDWFMCLFSRTLPWPVVLRIWDMFFCEGVKVLFKVALILVGTSLGDAKERSKCVTMYETLHLLKNLPPKFVGEKELIERVVNLELSDRDLEKEHHYQANRRRREKEEKARLKGQPNQGQQNGDLNKGGKASKKAKEPAAKSNLKQF